MDLDKIDGSKNVRVPPFTGLVNGAVRYRYMYSYRTVLYECTGGIIEGECSGTEFPFADRSCRPLLDLPQFFSPSISNSTLTR